MYFDWKKFKELWIFLLLLVLIIIRYPAIYYSLPDGSVFGHTRTYFQDEDAVVADTVKIIQAAIRNPFGILDPGQTIYPLGGRLLSFLPLSYFYLTDYRHINPAQIIAGSAQSQASFYAVLIFCGRLVSLIASWLLAYLLWRFYKKEKINSYLAFLGCLVFSSLPAVVILSLEAKSNLILGLVLATILVVGANWLRGGKDYLLWLSMFLVGIATGLQLNGILGGFIILSALLIRYQGKFWLFWKQKINWLIFIFPVLGLLIASPNLFFHQRYIVAMLNNAGSGALRLSLLVDWRQALASFYMLGAGWLGIGLLSLTLVISIWKFKKLSSALKLVVIWLLLYLFVFLQTELPIPRYGFPLLFPSFVLLIYWLDNIFKSANKKGKVVVGFIFVLWCFYAVFFGLAYMKLFKQHSVQLVANQYFEKIAQPGSSVGVYFNFKHYNRVPIDYSKYKLSVCRDLEDGLVSREQLVSLPDFVVTQTNSDYNCQNEIYDLSDNYVLIKNFHNNLTFVFLNFYAKEHWQNLQPTINIYKKK